IPTLATPASSLSTYNTATLGASISSINCSDVITRGIEWSTTNDFTNGTGTIVLETGVFGVGDFSFNVTGLIPNQTIYWKAFATNASGTARTAQQSFTTAQQYLSVGDLSILGFNTTNPDEFVFVNWAPITPNMIIKFTDNGFNAAAPSTQANNARGGENFVIWKNNTGADIDPGTVIKINGSTTTTGQIVSGGLTGITTTDQIFAYQGAATTGANPDWVSNGNPTTYTGTILFGVNIGTTGFLTTGTAASTSSYLPTELTTNGSIAITGTVAGSQYTATRSALGSILAYRSLVNNPANWTTASSGTITLNTTPFTVNPNVATQIAVTAINGGLNPSANTPFTVSFETRDANGAAASVGIDTDFAITIGAGTGALGGTLTGTIQAGSGTLTISGVTYNTAESGVALTVSASAGQSLTAGTSAPFTVDSAATHLAFVSLETFLYTGNAAPTFTVQARRNNGTVDLNYQGSVTLSIFSGTGSLLGTITKTVTNGVASFNDIAFDEPGLKQIQASTFNLTSGLSASLTVSTATLTELVLPQFIEGAQPSNSNRLPFVYRVALGGLKPNSTYRYYNSVVLGSESASSNGAGN
ncbi:MAG: beta strand repeat-containing protein, partial [Flavobacteriales bacterium]